MTQLRWQTHLGFVKEVSWGVFTTVPQTFVPVTNQKFQDKPKFYYDEAFRSVQAKDFGAYLTTLQGEFSFDADVYVDTFPTLTGAGMIGNNDTVVTVQAGSVNVAYANGTVSAHTFIIGNPSSLDLFDYNGFTEHLYQGCRFSEVQIKYAPDGQLQGMFKGNGRLSVVNASAGNVTAPVIGAFAPLLGWQGIVTWNGAPNTRLIESTFTLKRGVEVLFTQAGTQSPTNVYAFPIEVDGKISVDFQDETEYSYFINNNQSASFSIIFAQSASNAIQFTFPNPVYTSYEVNHGKDYLVADLEFRSITPPSTSTNIKMVVYTNRTVPF